MSNHRSLSRQGNVPSPCQDRAPIQHLANSLIFVATNGQDQIPKTGLFESFPETFTGNLPMFQLRDHAKSTDL